MKPRLEEMEQDNMALRERLTRLSQASLRTNQGPDFNTVLQETWTLPGADGTPLRGDDPPRRFGNLDFRAASSLREDMNRPGRKRVERPESVGFHQEGAESMDDADQTGRVFFPRGKMGSGPERPGPLPVLKLKEPGKKVEPGWRQEERGLLVAVAPDGS